MNGSVYIGLGTNQGDRLKNLAAAISAFPPSVIINRLSAVYETPPWGYHDQPSFLNQVVDVDTELAPYDLLGYLKNIEQDIGRKPTFKYGPRLIDLDILFYYDLIIESSDLTIPHPLLYTRAFVLVPLAELAPDLIYPPLGKTISELLLTVDIQGIHHYKPNGS